MGDGGGLHPVHVGGVVGVVQFVDLVAVNPMVVMVDGWHSVTGLLVGPRGSVLLW
jgi:hypothetical protein